MNKQIVIASISGGETSGMMAAILKQQYRFTYDIRYVFMNTSREKEETLVFLDKLDKYFDLNIVWLEAVINPEKGKGVRHRVTNFNDAKRNGEVFEDLIKKQGLPSVKSPHCTRDLKTRCCESYMKSIKAQKAVIAIGYRFDEKARVNLEKAKERNHWYPLYNLQITKPMVKAFYAKLPFSLGLLEWQGNCKLCFKKSLRKILTQILLEPETVEFITRMELQYPISPASGENVVMFRGSKSIFELISLSEEPFEQFIEPQYAQLDYELDEQESCGDSCEAFT